MHIDTSFLYSIENLTSFSTNRELYMDLLINMKTALRETISKDYKLFILRILL